MDKTCHGSFGHKSLCCSYTQLIMGKWKAIKTKMTEERKEALKYAKRQKTEYYNDKDSLNVDDELNKTISERKINGNIEETSRANDPMLAAHLFLIHTST